MKCTLRGVLEAAGAGLRELAPHGADLADHRGTPQLQCPSSGNTRESHAMAAGSSRVSQPDGIIMPDMLLRDGSCDLMKVGAAMWDVALTDY